MAADVGQAYCGWAPAPELAEQQETQELSVSDDEFSSFGSFKFDSLDWEKRSVFTRNRCLEELEKFKTPGLVARKKAFFEERYKKNRAQKAMGSNQQVILDDGSARSISNQVKDETSVHEKESCEDIQIQNTSSTFLSSKAMGENQQLILDDGSACSISNQVKDETSVHEKQNCEDIQIQNTSSTFLSSKAMGENQQLILDDGSARSISNQVKDETSVHEKQICEDNQIQNTSSTFLSSTAVWLDVNKETADDCYLHLPDLDSEVSMLESLKRTEVIEPHTHMNIDDRDTLRTDNSELTAQLEKVSSGAEVQIHQRDRPVTGRPSLVQAELVEESQFSGHDDKDTSMKNHILESNEDLATAGTVIHHANSELTAQLEKVSSGAEIQIHQRDTPVTGLPSLVQSELVEESQFSGHDVKDTSMKNRILESNEDLATAGTVIHHANSDAVQSDDKDIAMKNCISESYVDLSTAVTVIHYANSEAVKSDSSIAQEKDKSHVRKQKGNAAVIKLMKGPVSSARCVLKVDFKSQTITSQPPKHHSQQLVGKAQNALGPSNATSDKVSRNIRSSTVALQKPLPGACSKSTIPVPVSFGMERRTRDNVLKLQEPAWKAARTCSVNNGESEDKRGSEQIPKKRPTSSRGRVANLPEPSKDQKIGDRENKRASGQVKERRPTSHSGRVTNLSEPPNQKNKEMENKGGSDEVREKRPISCLGRPVNIKNQKSEGTVNRRDSEQDRGKRGLIREPLKDQKSSTRENKRCSELVREKILPGGPMLRAVNVPEPPKEKRSKGSENLRDSEQVRERALPKVIANVSDSNAKISRSVNLLAQYRSTVAVRKNEPNEVASSRADPFSHKGKRPLSGSRSQNGTLPRQEMRPWR